MKQDEDIFEIEIDEDEIKNISTDILRVGIQHKIHPGKFLIALIHASKSICNHEGIELSNLITLVCNEDDPHLH